jgi:Na+/melibiose symporter-like transporter
VLAAFVVWELRSDHPMLNVSFFKNPRFTAASLAVTLTFFALFGSLFLTTQYLQSVLGFSALAAGVRIIPFAAVMMLLAPQSPKLAERFGTKIVVTIGLLLVAAGLGTLAFVEPASGYTPVFISFVILASGMALTMAPATESIMGSLPRDKAGVGSAVNDTTRQVGGALGVAIIGSVYSSMYADQIGHAIAGKGLPAEAASTVSDSIGGALGVAHSIGGESGQALIAASRAAFVEGMHRGVLVGVAVALIGALVALLFLPARAPESAEAGIDPSAPNLFDLRDGEPGDLLTGLDEIVPHDGSSVGDPDSEVELARA